jgi:hypothetical protein
MKHLIFLAIVSIPTAGFAQEVDSFESLKESYFKHLPHHSDLSKDVLIQMGKRGDQAAIPFLRDIYTNAKPTSINSYTRKYPNIKFMRTLAGYAQIALAQLGEEDVLQELVKQSFHEDELVRMDALEKIKKIEGNRVIEMLSNFLGDADDESERLDYNEWFALWELAERLQNPPTPFEGLKHHKIYYREGGKEKWLKWRYDHFGVIPGREKLFEPFIEQGPPKTQKLTAADLKPVAKAIVNAAATEIKTPEVRKQAVPLWASFAGFAAILGLLVWWLKHRRRAASPQT